MAGCPLWAISGHMRRTTACPLASIHVQRVPYLVRKPRFDAFGIRRGPVSIRPPRLAVGGQHLNEVAHTNSRTFYAASGRRTEMDDYKSGAVLGRIRTSQSLMSNLALPLSAFELPCASAEVARLFDQRSFA